MIRYDTGDLGVMSHECECGIHGKVLKRVEDRRGDFITATNGDLLSPITIINAMWNTPICYNGSSSSMHHKNSK